MATGIDLSHWKSITDFKALADKSSGVDFIFSKASEGTYFTDWTWPTNFAGLRAQGFQKIAPFHFLSGEDPAAQFAYFINVGLKVTPIDGTFPLMIDWERYASALQAAQFARLIYNAYGTWPYLYTSEEVIKALGGTGALPADLLACYLVYADYSQNGAYPVPQWTQWTMRQFNDGVYGAGPYLAPGIATGVDHDLLNPAFDLETIWNASLAKVITPPVPAAPVMITVPYIGQWDQTAAKYRDDCGSTCTEMVREWAGLPVLTVDSLSAQTTLATNDNGLWPSQLVPLAATNGLTLVLKSGVTVDSIKAEINAGRPVIALINYSYIVGREDKGFFGNHFVVVTGYDSQSIYVNDPDFWGANETQGHNFAIPLQQFSDALLYDHNGQECLFVTTVPVTTPPTPNIKQMVGNDPNGTNIRSAPSHTATIVGSIKGGDPLSVDLATLSGGYVQIVSGSFDKFWILLTELADPPAPAPSNEVTMYVNTPPVNGVTQHLFVHSQVPQGVNRYITSDPYQADAPPGELDDQTKVKVLLPPTNGSDKNGNPVAYVQISPNSEPAAGLWLEYDLLSLTPRSSTPPVSTNVIKPRAGISRMGEHYYQGGEWLLQDVSDRTPLVVVLRQGYQSELTPSQVRQKMPNGIIVERWDRNWNPGIDWNQADLRAVGDQLCTQYASTFPIDRAANYHTIINEPRTGPGTASFWQGAMDAAAALGIKLTIGVFPVFWPALPGEQRADGADPNWLLNADVIAMLRRAKLRGDVLALHEYIFPDPGGAWDAGPMIRHQSVIAALPSDLVDLPILITEFGTGVGAHMSSDEFITHISAADAYLKSHSANVIGAALWVAGPWGKDGASNLGAHRVALVKYWQQATS